MKLSDDRMQERREQRENDDIVEQQRIGDRATAEQTFAHYVTVMNTIANLKTNKREKKICILCG